MNGLKPKAGLIRRVKQGLLNLEVSISSSSEEQQGSSSVTALSSANGRRSSSSDSCSVSRNGSFFDVRRGVIVAGFKVGKEGEALDMLLSLLASCEPEKTGLLRRARLNVGIISSCCEDVATRWSEE